MKRKNDAEIKFKVNLDSNSAETTLSKLGGVGKSVFKGLAIGVGTVSTALGGLVAKSVSLAGQLEQNVGGAEAVFGDLGDNIDQMSMKTQTFNKETGKMEESISNLQDVSMNAYKNMGLSQSDYLATVNKMGALMQGSGIDIQDSLNLSSQAMQRAADVASIMGIDINSAMESIAGAAKGNFTMMDILGVAMNATTIEAYAMSKGIDKSFDSMSKAEQVQYAMEMFLESSSYAMGNYVKENETFAGSLSTMKASINNFLSGAGDIDAVIDSVLSFADILIESIGNMAPKIVAGIVGLINGIVPQLPKMLQNLLPSIIDGAVSLIEGLVSALPTLIPILMNGIVQAFSSIVQIIPDILNALLNATIQIMQSLSNSLPTLIPMLVEAILEIIPVLLDNIPLFITAGIQLIIGLAQGLIQAIPTLITYIPEIIQGIINTIIGLLPQIILLGPQIILGLITGLISAIPDLVMAVPKIITSLIEGFFDGIGQFLKVGTSIISNIWNGIKNAFVGVLNKIPGIPNDIKKKITDGLGNIGDIGKNLVQGLWNGINNAKNWVLEKIKGFGKSILNGIKGIFGINSPSKVMFEIGGYIDEGFINGIEDMEKDVNKQVDSTFGSGLDYLYNGYDNFALGLPNTTYTSIPSQTIYLNNTNSNSNILQVDGRVLAETVNNYNNEREVAV